MLKIGVNSKSLEMPIRQYAKKWTTCLKRPLLSHLLQQVIMLTIIVNGPNNKQ